MSTGPRPTVLVAPDSFKGTYSAREVASYVADGVERAGATAVRCPVADGGEGTGAALLAARGGTEVAITAHDPLGRPVQATYALLGDGDTAVVETAAASGLGWVTPDPETAVAASTAGTGELIVAAARSGARRVLVALGGSATTDGGLGALEAIDAAGGLHGVEVIALCDVTTTYERAAHVFGPQKGADTRTVQRLAERLAERARALPCDPRGVAMTGAAGGLSGALWAVHGARLVSGAGYVLDLVGFGAMLVAADAVVTGEGRLDASSHEGKLVGEVARRCARAGVPAHAVVGSVDPRSADDPRFASVTVAPTARALRRVGVHGLVG